MYKHNAGLEHLWAYIYIYIENFSAHVGVFWDPPGLFSVSLGPSCAHLGTSQAHLGQYYIYIISSWIAFGSSGAFLRSSGAFLAAPGLRPFLLGWSIYIGHLLRSSCQHVLYAPWLATSRFSLIFSQTLVKHSLYIYIYHLEPWLARWRGQFRARRIYIYIFWQRRMPREKLLGRKDSRCQRIPRGQYIIFLGTSWDLLWLLVARLRFHCFFK